MNCKIVYRCEGNPEIGHGHIMRLLAIANYVNAKSYFVISKQSSYNIIPSEYDVKFIEAGLTNNEEVEWYKKKFETSNSIIILDGYQFDENYQLNLKNAGFRFVYIDDLMSFYQHADIVINHALGISENDYEKAKNTKLALGSKYALLRSEFLEGAKIIKKEVNLDTGFVCFGGADPHNFTEKAISALLSFETIKLINVVIGASYKHIASLKHFEKDLRVKIYYNLKAQEMVEVMKVSSIAIVPSSTIVYELCCIKMPIICGYYVDNQKKIYEGLLSENVIIGAGDITNYEVKDFCGQIEKVISKGSFYELLNKQFNLFNYDVGANIYNLIKELC